MQANRKSVVAGLLFSFTLAAAAVAAPQREDPNHQPHSRAIRKAEKPPNPWIGMVAAILDELQGWPSIPPG